MEYATEKLNYYFYEEASEHPGYFTVFYGNNESQFMASFVAEFASEDDAGQYVDWKNLALEIQEGGLVDEEYNPDDELILDKELDEGGVEDLVSMFSRTAKEDLD